MTDINDAEIRRLRAEVHTLREEKDILQEQLAFAWQKVEYLRERIPASTLKTAAPRDFERAGLVPVTAAEIREVGARLHDLLDKLR